MTSTDSTSFEVVEDQEESLSRLFLRENKHYEIEKNPFLACFRMGTAIVEPEIPSKVDSSSVPLFFVGFDWGLERIGKKKFTSASLDVLPITNRNCVVMFPTNGRDSAILRDC